VRTTLDIAEDVLQAAKEIARKNQKTAGQVLSELAREALSRPAGRTGAFASRRRPEEFLGFKPFAGRGGLVTDEIVNRLREDDGD
jgi:hypothetical protein